MLNNPKIIERIKEDLRNTTKEQIMKAIEIVEKKYNEYVVEEQCIEINNNEVYTMENEYYIFPIHKSRTSRFLNIFHKKERNDKELEAA